MNSPTLPDPLAPLKSHSPSDPIIPALEHIITNQETMKGYTKSIARDATSLRNTRIMVFFIACLFSAAIGSGGTWWFLSKKVTPGFSQAECETLTNAGLTLRVLKNSKQVALQVIGPVPEKTGYNQPESKYPGYLLVWRNEEQ